MATDQTTTTPVPSQWRNDCLSDKSDGGATIALAVIDKVFRLWPDDFRWI